jgi:hypothetical protein
VTNAAKKVNDLMREADELRRTSQAFAAMGRFARIERLLKDLPSTTRDGVRAQLEASQPSEPEMAAIRDSARDYLQKLSRILAVSSEYTFEELAWIVTLRTDLGLVENFLRTRNYGELGISTAHVDHAILELAEDPTSGKQLDSADRHVRKHGGVSLADVGVLKAAPAG